MESVVSSPETALDLIGKVGALVSQASALLAAVTAGGQPEAWHPALSPEEWAAVLSNTADSLMEASAALRAKGIAAGAFARARQAGDADGYERGLEDGRREGQAGRRARARHVALVHRAAG
jgi:flagellar biosynthesis/type III secretory pathway protein FliH